MEKSIILYQLYKKGFNLIHIKDFEDTDYILFTKEHINIILCYYINQIAVDEIEEEAKNLRSLMHKNKINVWNTYMLISFDYEIDYQKLFVIERSSKSIRRYVISKEQDFNRIPFLDTIEVISNPFNLTSQTTVGSDNQIKRIIEFFQEHNGDNVKIKSSTIQNKFNTLFDLED